MPRTCLYENHLKAGATMVDFHGWEMPIRYTQIPQEHQKVRLSAGLFDLCHMGRLEFSGPGAEEWVQSVVTTDVSRIEIGHARYSLICDPNGGIIDDIIIYRLPKSLFLVVNASNRDTVKPWFEEHKGGRDAELTDRSEELGMLSIQGPQYVRILTPLVEWTEHALGKLPYYHIMKAKILGKRAFLATTGYTGENGFEIYLPSEAAPEFWDKLLETGNGLVAPIGLGARDTLRVEAGMPLYGNELTRETNPFEAGLGFAVKLQKPIPFIGQEALARLGAEGPKRKLVGLRIFSKKVARQGMPIYNGEPAVGIVTSGIPSPTLGFPIAMGYVDKNTQVSDNLEVDVRGTRVQARLEPLPFFSRTRHKAAHAL